LEEKWELKKKSNYFLIISLQNSPGIAKCVAKRPLKDHPENY